MLRSPVTSTDGPNRPGSHRTTPPNRTYRDGQRELGPDPGSALCRSPGRGQPPPAARRWRGKTLAAWPLSLAGASAASAGEYVRPGSRPPRLEPDVHGNGPYRTHPERCGHPAPRQGRGWAAVTCRPAGLALDRGHGRGTIADGGAPPRPPGGRARPRTGGDRALRGPGSVARGRPEGQRGARRRPGRCCRRAEGTAAAAAATVAARACPCARRSPPWRGVPPAPLPDSAALLLVPC